jgi:hypothetical protein
MKDDRASEKAVCRVSKAQSIPPPTTRGPSGTPTFSTPPCDCRYSPCASQVENDVSGTLSPVAGAGASVAGAGATTPLAEQAASAMNIEGNVTTSIQTRSISRRDAFVIPTSLELSDSEGEVNQAPQPLASVKRSRARERERERATRDLERRNHRPPASSTRNPRFVASPCPP